MKPDIPRRNFKQEKQAVLASFLDGSLAMRCMPGGMISNPQMQNDFKLMISNLLLVYVNQYVESVKLGKQSKFDLTEFSNPRYKDSMESIIKANEFISTLASKSSNDVEYIRTEREGGVKTVINNALNRLKVPQIKLSEREFLELLIHMAEITREDLSVFQYVEDGNLTKVHEDDSKADEQSKGIDKIVDQFIEIATAALDEIKKIEEEQNVAEIEERNRYKAILEQEHSRPQIGENEPATKIPEQKKCEDIERYITDHRVDLSNLNSIMDFIYYSRTDRKNGNEIAISAVKKILSQINIDELKDYALDFITGTDEQDPIIKTALLELRTDLLPSMYTEAEITKFSEFSEYVDSLGK